MMTVVDQQSPWLMPRSTLARTIQSQLGASMMMTGTGKPKSHPATRICLRPMRSEKRPAKRLASALTTPKETMKESAIVREARPNSCSASSGTIVRSNPTMPPTKALISTRRLNCCQFSRRPRRTAGAAVLRDGTAIGSRLEIGRVAVRHLAGFVEGDDPGVVGRSRRDACQDRVEKGLLRESQHPNPPVDVRKSGGDGAMIEGRRFAGMAREDDRPRGECSEAHQRRMQQPRSGSRLLGTRLQIGSANAGQEERVTGEEHFPVQEVTGALQRVPGRPQRDDAGGADAKDVSIANGSEGIHYPILLRHVQRRSRLLGEEAGSAQVIRVDVGIHDVADGPAVLSCEVLIDLRRQGRVDDDGLTV